MNNSKFIQCLLNSIFLLIFTINLIQIYDFHTQTEQTELVLITSVKIKEDKVSQNIAGPKLLT